MATTVGELLGAVLLVAACGSPTVTLAPGTVDAAPRGSTVAPTGGRSPAAISTPSLSPTLGPAPGDSVVILEKLMTQSATMPGAKVVSFRMQAKPAEDGYALVFRPTLNYVNEAGAIDNKCAPHVDANHGRLARIGGGWHTEWLNANDGDAVLPAFPRYDASAGAYGSQTADGWVSVRIKPNSDWNLAAPCGVAVQLAAEYTPIHLSDGSVSPYVARTPAVSIPAGGAEVMPTRVVPVLATLVIEPPGYGAHDAAALPAFASALEGWNDAVGPIFQWLAMTGPTEWPTQVDDQLGLAEIADSAIARAVAGIGDPTLKDAAAWVGMNLRDEFRALGTLHLAYLKAMSNAQLSQIWDEGLSDLRTSRGGEGMVARTFLDALPVDVPAELRARLAKALGEPR